MTVQDRSNVVSSFTAIKGPMISETYEVFRAWDLAQSKKANLDRLRTDNYIGTSSATWLRDVAFVISRRFDPGQRDLGLVILAKASMPLEQWKPLLLWHITRDEFLLRDFLLNWLFPEFEGGALRLRTKDLDPFLRTLRDRGGALDGDWTDSTRDHVAGALLKAATDFGLLRGTKAREFAGYHLPEQSFLYLLHALRDELVSPQKIIDSPDWRMYLMAPDDVERELLRLHQFRKLRYDAAGSLVQLTLPYDTALDYANAIA